MDFATQKWFSEWENGFYNLEMIWRVRKWILQLGNDLASEKMDFTTWKWFGEWENGSISHKMKPPLKRGCDICVVQASREGDTLYLKSGHSLSGHLLGIAYEVHIGDNEARWIFHCEILPLKKQYSQSAPTRIHIKMLVNIVTPILRTVNQNIFRWKATRITHSGYLKDKLHSRTSNTRTKCRQWQNQNSFGKAISL